MRSHRIALASLLGLLALVASRPAEAACEGKQTCSVGTASLHGEVTKRLDTPIDSGELGGSKVKVQAKFYIEPVAGDPLVKLDLSNGALLQATWAEKGFLDLTAINDNGKSGSVVVRYTLAPNLHASIFGITVDRTSTDLLNKIPGASFNYDAKAGAPITPWGFDGTQVAPAAPPLADSTLFSIPFSDLGVSTDIATGTLGIQAAAEPIFQYRTTSVRLNGATLSSSDATTRITAPDADFVEIQAQVGGELGVAGTLTVKPTANATSIAKIPVPGGLGQIGFDAATVDISGASTPVTFQTSTIHIPLPNVKMPEKGVDFGSVSGGATTNGKAILKNTGELGATLTFESSDPQFVVAGGPVTVAPKGTYELPIAFKAISGAPASATITVTSNDPDSPVQTFKVGGNGADVGAGTTGGGSSNESGCAAAPGSSTGAGSFAAMLGLGLALLGLRRRR